VTARWTAAEIPDVTVPAAGPVSLGVQTRTLGNTDLAITRIGFGSWAVGGGDYQFGWGPQDDATSIATIHRALDHGINWIDTAAVYGLGHSEEVVGRAIAGRATRPYVFTKCSLRWTAERSIYRSLAAGSIREECEASLRRLGVDVIDLYQIHWPDPPDDIREGWEALARLQEEGKVRHIGVSNFSVAQMEQVKDIAPIASLQPPYSLIRRDIETDILPYCAAHDIGVIVYSPMGSGLLTGTMTRERVNAFAADDWRRGSPRFQEPSLTHSLQVADVLKRIATRHGRSAGEVAIAWTLRHPAVTAAIVGGRSAQQVDGVVGGADLQLAGSDLDAIAAVL
jgi:aryl-alcohol dehydrogenase-like predicted oxidoreductase